VALALPLESVITALAGMVPQAVPLVGANVIESPETAAFVTSLVTLAVTVEVETPSPLIVGGFAVTLTVNVMVWVIGAVAELPALASVANALQVPAVVPAV
jgi:hypothetical protein